MKDAVIVAGKRTAIGKAPRGALKDTRSDYLGKLVVEDVVRDLGPNFDKSSIDDVIIAASGPEGSQGGIVGRTIAIYAGLPESVPGITINRYCCGGLQAISYASERVMVGGADIIIAGGIESMSQVASKRGIDEPNNDIINEYPELYTAMGMTAENVARQFNITREQQDAFALISHNRAEKAIRDGVFADQITPVPIKQVVIGPDHKAIVKEKIFNVDEGVRTGMTLEGLSKLRPAFTPKGTVTAGSSSQTSDGAAVVAVMSADKAKELGLKPRLRYVGYAVAGCPAGVMGIGPIYAIPKVLKQTGFTLKDLGLIELNEAFASQAVYCVNTLGINTEITNVNGGAIALGHPLGCTGAKLTVQIMHEMEKRKVRYGMVAMCIGAGMGAAGIFELID